VGDGQGGDLFVWPKSSEPGGGLGWVGNGGGWGVFCDQSPRK
jgi:hypothetical protein